MSETTHANDQIHGVHAGGAPRAALHGDGAPEDAAHADHAHGSHGAPLGPIDWFAWGAGFLGVGAGLVVAACLYISTSL